MDPYLIEKISSTSKTALITLHAHAIESLDDTPIIVDPEAIRIQEALKDTLSNGNDRLLKNLAKGKLNKQLVYHISMRAKKYDTYAETFIADNPNAIIVNLGCGLDSRFQRLKNKPSLFLDIDLPEMIDIKRDLFEEDDTYKMIGQSIFNPAWFNDLKGTHHPVLFIAEGLFMYLHEEALQEWLKKLGHAFPNSHLLFETVLKKYTHGFYQKMTEFKLRKELGVTGDVSYHFGLEKSSDLEKLSHNFQLIEDWSYFDEGHPKVGWMNIMGKFDYFKYVQWTVYYKITPPLL